MFLVKENNSIGLSWQGKGLCFSFALFFGFGDALARWLGNVPFWLLFLFFLWIPVRTLLHFGQKNINDRVGYADGLALLEERLYVPTLLLAILLANTNALPSPSMRSWFAILFAVCLALIPVAKGFRWLFLYLAMRRREEEHIERVESELEASYESTPSEERGG